MQRKASFYGCFSLCGQFFEGRTNADRIVDLQRRLRLLLTDLNEYFERILLTVDNFYRKQAAQMSQVTLMAHATLPLIAYCFVGQEYLKLIETFPMMPLKKKSTSAD
jgi:hypothetical protein